MVDKSCLFIKGVKYTMCNNDMGVLIVGVLIVGILIL